MTMHCQHVHEHVPTKFYEKKHYVAYCLHYVSYIYVKGHFSALLIFYENKNEKANY
jgi:acetate kinase